MANMLGESFGTLPTFLYITIRCFLNYLVQLDLILKCLDFTPRSEFEDILKVIHLERL